MAPADIQAEVVETQLHRLLASPGLARNEHMSRFLRFIVEQKLSGRESELKESLLPLLLRQLETLTPSKIAVVKNRKAS